jgi:ACR3 family arsenite efflux pump ArsB
MKPLVFIQKNLTWSITVVMVLGIIYGYFFDSQPLKKFILAVTLVMIYPMMVTLNFKKLFSKGDSKVLWVSQLVNFVFFPLIGLLIGKLFFKDNSHLVAALLLIALIPTSGMTISWTGFAKGNISAAVKLTVLGLLLGTLLSPFYLQVIIGKSIQVPLLTIMKQIGIVVFVPMLFGYLTRRLIIKKFGEERFQKEIKQQFPPKSTLGVLGIVFIVMALKSKMIISNPAILLTYLFPVLLFYLIGFVFTVFLARSLFDKANAIPMVYGTALRNHSIALAIAVSVFQQFGAEMAMVIALAIIIQIQSAAFSVKYIDKLFGKKVRASSGVKKSVLEAS